VVACRRASNRDQVARFSELAMKHNPSVDFCGYWQRAANKVIKA